MPIKKQLIDYAENLLNNPHTQEVLDLITLQAMERFRTASADERAAISDMLDNRDLFFKELRYIVADSKQPNETEEIQPLTER